MTRVSLLASLVALLGHISASADGILVPQVDSICATLVGTKVFSSHWQRLMPFLRQPRGRVSTDIWCSASCSGTILLRDDMEVRFTYSDVPRSGHVWAPVESVALYRYGRLIAKYNELNNPLTTVPEASSLRIKMLEEPLVDPWAETMPLRDIVLQLPRPSITIWSTGLMEGWILSWDVVDDGFVDYLLGNSGIVTLQLAGVNAIKFEYGDF